MIAESDFDMLEVLDDISTIYKNLGVITLNEKLWLT